MSLSTASILQRCCRPADLGAQRLDDLLAYGRVAGPEVQSWIAYWAHQAGLDFKSRLRSEITPMQPDGFPLLLDPVDCEKAHGAIGFVTVQAAERGTEQTLATNQMAELARWVGRWFRDNVSTALDHLEARLSLPAATEGSSASLSVLLQLTCSSLEVPRHRRGWPRGAGRMAG